MMQPMSSLGTVISWVCVPAPVPTGDRSWEPASAARAATEPKTIQRHEYEKYLPSGNTVLSETINKMNENRGMFSYSKRLSWFETHKHVKYQIDKIGQVIENELQYI